MRFCTTLCFSAQFSRHRRNATALATVSLGAIPFAAAPHAAHAQISGFGVSGSGYTLNTNGNGAPSITNGVLQITSASGSQSHSAYFNTKQNISAFTASFVYQDVSINGADGFTFVLQNQGINALGTTGGGLGYGGITPSAAIAFNIFNTSGTGFDVNGSVATGSTGNVNLRSGSAILVNLAYDGTTLMENLTDQSNNNVFTASYTTNLTTQLGANTAYVGFTGGTGGSNADQRISNFTFTSAGAPEPGSFALLGMGLVPLTSVVLRRRRAAKTTA